MPDPAHVLFVFQLAGAAFIAIGFWAWSEKVKIGCSSHHISSSHDLLLLT